MTRLAVSPAVRLVLTAAAVVLLAAACGGSGSDVGGRNEGPQNRDNAAQRDQGASGPRDGDTAGDSAGSLPQITVSPVDPARVTAVSKFRSCSGHDFSPGARGRGGPDSERARSMKNYLQTDLALDAVGEVPILAPFDGRIEIRSEQFDLGKQVYVRANGWALRLFHIDPSVEDGAQVKAGQKIGSIVPANAQEMLGKQIGPDGKQRPYEFDIAVTNQDDSDFRSMFDLMDTKVAEQWAARGFTKDNTTISKAERDASPCVLAADGERFEDQGGSAADWVQAS